MHLLAQAKGNYAIASIMGVGEGTVRTHVQSIRKKLLVENRWAAGLHYLRFTGRLRDFA